MAFYYKLCQKIISELLVRTCSKQHISANTVSPTVSIFPSLGTLIALLPLLSFPPTNQPRCVG